LYTRGSTEDDIRHAARENQRNINISNTNNLVFTITESPQQFIDRIGSTIEEVIYSTLTNTVTIKQPRPKDWKWFWTEQLQHLAETRQSLCRQWCTNRARKAGIEVVSLCWSDYQTACKAFKSELKKTKRKLWKQFCEKMTSLPAGDVYTVIKRIRKKHTTTKNYSHIDGPQAAANEMANHLSGVFGGDQD
jgi:hypothetical protein